MGRGVGARVGDKIGGMMRRMMAIILQIMTMMLQIIMMMLQAMNDGAGYIL